MSEYTNIRWADAAQTKIAFDLDGHPITAVARPDLLHFRAIQDAGLSIGPYQPTADDVRNEAQRRIMMLVGVSSLDKCMVKQLNALMRATELTRKEAAEGLTPAEQAEAIALQGMADAIKAIRAASNVLEPDPPADYTNDAHWPT